MEVNEAIKLALPVFVEYRTTADLEILGLVLPKTGMSREIAWQIVDFVPLAFGRAFMKDLSVGFSDKYERYTAKNGKAIDRESKKLMDEPVFSAALALALAMIADGKVQDLGFQVVLERSAELNAIKKLVNEKGSKPENIVLSPPYLPRR